MLDAASEDWRRFAELRTPECQASGNWTRIPPFFRIPRAPTRYVTVHVPYAPAIPSAGLTSTPPSRGTIGGIARGDTGREEPPRDFIGTPRAPVAAKLALTKLLRVCFIALLPLLELLASDGPLSEPRETRPTPGLSKRRLPWPLNACGEALCRRDRGPIGLARPGADDADHIFVASPGTHFMSPFAWRSHLNLAPLKRFWASRYPIATWQVPTNMTVNKRGTDSSYSIAPRARPIGTAESAIAGVFSVFQ